ncbi:hypothetical protein BDZ94DRAFT_533392 [Collybia nuda]|uniref:Uncharacterized protein n=1 Tax=Collybia nuda TaxID=64659 RepID=A0A9P5Y9Z8_9AGAR|nr:hypothetical protein BDZ94DRAFT_533392 [Collybia nuda]
MSNDVQMFNTLPRTKLTTSKLVKNDWIFTIRHVDIDPEADLLMLVNPGSRFSHCEGPVHLENLSYEDKGGVVANLLIRAFNSAMGDPDAPKLAPWTWMTNDLTLAKAVEVALKALGVVGDLCAVELADLDARKVADEQWKDLICTIKRSVGK